MPNTLALSIPIPYLSAIGAAAFLAALFVLFKLGQARSRGQVMAVKNVFDLPAASASRELAWDIKSAPPDDEIADRVAGMLASYGATITRNDGWQLAAHFGSRAEAKMHGLWKADPLQMPTRVILLLYTGGDGAMVRVRLDEDFGFKLFFGPVKRKFNVRYSEVFDRIEWILIEALKPMGAVRAAKVGPGW